MDSYGHPVSLTLFLIKIEYFLSYFKSILAANPSRDFKSTTYCMCNVALSCFSCVPHVLFLICLCAAINAVLLTCHFCTLINVLELFDCEL